MVYRCTLLSHLEKKWTEGKIKKYLPKILIPGFHTVREHIKCYFFFLTEIKNISYKENTKLLMTLSDLNNIICLHFSLIFLFLYGLFCWTQRKLMRKLMFCWTEKVEHSLAWWKSDESHGVKAQDNSVFVGKAKPVLKWWNMKLGFLHT